MGVYVFSTKALKSALSSNSTPVNGITLDVLPPLIQQDAVSVYRFGGTVGRVSRDQYWRNVPTLDDYFAANMDLLEPVPPLNLYQFGWEIGLTPVSTRPHEPYPARVVMKVFVSTH